MCWHGNSLLWHGKNEVNVVENGPIFLISILLLLESDDLKPLSIFTPDFEYFYP